MSRQYVVWMIVDSDKDNAKYLRITPPSPDETDSYEWMENPVAATHFGRESDAPVGVQVVLRAWEKPPSLP